MKPQKGLGRGLDAIFSSEKIEPKIKPMGKIAEVELSNIVANPMQPRRQFDEESIEGLAESIRALGVIQPITLKAEGDKYVIISGERRWRASQRAALEVIPAYIREVNDEELHTMALVENVQREDLNPLEIAFSLQRLVEECGLTQEALAKRVGIKRPTISNYLRLLQLPSAVQLALKSGIITMGHAKAIAGVEDTTKQIALLKRCVDRALSVRQTEELARVMQESAEPEVKPSLEPEYPESYLRLVEQLEGYFSQNISIKRSKSGGGKITIDFKDDQEIETFISRFEQNRG